MDPPGFRSSLYYITFFSKYCATSLISELVKKQILNACISNEYHIKIRGRLHEPGLTGNLGQDASPVQRFSRQTPVTVYMDPPTDPVGSQPVFV